MTLDLSSIRDADLVRKLDEAQPFLRDVVARQCAEEQRRRDTLSAMPDGQRRRHVTRTLFEEGRGIERDNLRHIHSVLALCSLPVTAQPIEVREWTRRQGKMNLMVSAGKLVSPETGEWVDQPLPWGSRARLILLHTCSEAIRQKSPVVQIEDSLSGFMKAIGIAVTGGRNGTLHSFKSQINALAACTMKIGVWDGNRAKTVNTQPFSSIDVWFPTNPDQPMMWPSTVTFSQDFYQSLTKHALPVNMHAVRAFSGSTRKLDILFWLGFRMNSLAKPLPISWEALTEQWGTGYSKVSNFKREFAKEIEQIKEVFPKLPFKLTGHGAVISPGTPDVLALPSKPRKAG